MNFIILVPGLLTALIGAFKGWRGAFIYGLLPTLVFFPNYYIFKVAGIPELTFWSGSIVAVFALWLIEGAWSRLRLEFADAVVLAYVLWCAVAEQDANGTKEAQNLLAKMVLGILMPYALGRSLRQDSELLWNCLKMMTVYAAFLFLLGPYEARMGSNPFDFWQRIIPTAGDWSGVLYRNGVRRVSASFSHSICYGYFAMMMLPIAIWLHATRSFASQWRSAAVIALCLVALFLSGSRGAMLGAAIAVGTLLLIWSPRRSYLIPITLAVLALGGLLVLPIIQDMMQMNRNEGASESVQTAAYRAEMIRNYIEICKTHPYFGFGRDNLPVVNNMKSIDNEYLWLSLNFGFPSACLLVLVAVAGILTQLPSVVSRIPVSPWCKFDAVLIGILLGAIGVQATVFAGTQTEQFFFLFVGMGGAPKVVGFAFGNAGAGEFSVLAGSALSPAVRVPWYMKWWRRAAVCLRAEHGPLIANMTHLDMDAAGCEMVSAPIHFTCHNCTQYPPYERKLEAALKPWWERLYRWAFRRDMTLKPICRKCGWYQQCGLENGDATESSES